MNYIDVYKKKLKLNGNSASNEREKTTTNIITQNFKEDPSYKDAVIKSTDLSENSIGVRVVNIDTSPDEKRLYMLPNTEVSVGSYIIYKQKNKQYTYLVDSFEDNLISPFAKGVRCKNVLKWIDLNGNVQEYPCVVSYQSYGVKIFQSNNDFIQETSTNIDVEIPRNSITEQIPLSLRVMFGKSQFGIYKVGDVATYEEGILKLTCKKDKYLENLDDIDNNLPWNGDNINPQAPSTYTIDGEGTVKINKEYTYVVTPQEGNITFELDKYAVSENIAEITPNSYSCTLRALKSDELVTLSVIKDGQIVTSIDIDTVKY